MLSKPPPRGGGEAGNWVRIRPGKQSHGTVRYNPEPVLRVNFSNSQMTNSEFQTVGFIVVYVTMNTCEQNETPRQWNLDITKGQGTGKICSLYNDVSLY